LFDTGYYIKTLFDTLRLILTVAVGYELIKSLHTIVISDISFPSLPLVQVAIIAVCNKIITLDIHHIDAMYVFGLATLIVALGITYFLLKPKAESINNTSQASKDADA